MINTTIHAHRPNYTHINDLNQFIDDLYQLLQDHNYKTGPINHIQTGDIITLNIQTDPKLIQHLINTQTTKLTNSKITIHLNINTQPTTQQDYQTTATHHLTTLTLHDIKQLATQHLINTYKQNPQQYYTHKITYQHHSTS